MKLVQFLIPLYFFVFGIVLTIVGALFKIQHWPYGSEILLGGSFFELLGIIITIIILIKFYSKS